MKREIILITFLIILTALTHAGSVGISPAFFKVDFEPYLEKNFTFNVYNSDQEDHIGIYVKGDLAEYVNISNNFFQGKGQFTAILKLPDKIEIPGKHRILIGAVEAKNVTEAGRVGGLAAVQAPIDVFVPYPGKYIESEFNIHDINEKEKTEFEINIDNLGTEDVVINAVLDIYSENENGKKLITKEIEDMFLNSKETTRIKDFLETEDFEPGSYYAELKIDFGRELVLNDTFKVGQFLVDIEDYDYQFEVGKINEFNIMVKNLWNTPVSPIYADVTITDQGKVMATFKTVSVDAAPWEAKNLTGYFDATNFESKRYLANINVKYADEVSHKLVAIYVNQPVSSIYKKYIIAAIIIIFIITLTYIYLIWKIYRLKGENNGKRKK